MSNQEQETKQEPRDLTDWPLPTSMLSWRKKTAIKAIQITFPFKVRSKEGAMTGKPGDWLAVGIQGERYVIDQEIFAKTYEPVLGIMTPHELRRIQEGKDDDGTCPSYDPLTHRCFEDPTVICGDEHAIICLTRIEAKRIKYKLKKEEAHQS